MYKRQGEPQTPDTGESGDVPDQVVDQVPDTGDSVFQIVEGNFTWNEAQADAEAKGGKFAVLNNKEKIDSIKNDESYVENMAREEFGLIKEGEEYFEIEPE